MNAHEMKTFNAGFVATLLFYQSAFTEEMVMDLQNANSLRNTVCILLLFVCLICLDSFSAGSSVV